MFELREHQKRALENVKEIFEEDNKAIVVQPTGVGKTYIALKLFEENKDKKLTFVAPSQVILWEIKLKIAKEYSVKPEEYTKIFKNLELTTYQQINVDKKKDDSYIDNFNSDYVVFDEAHHIGSDKWGANAIELMEGQPETKFLGLTATPERTDGIDVVKDVFGGNLADEMSLEEAVADRLLKMPDYVNAIYSYKPIIEDLEERIESLEKINPEKYIMLKKDMEKAKNALEKADGMPEIFAKHIKEKDGRFIIFCKNIEHLKEMVNDSKTKGWFDGVNKNVETLEIHSLEDDEQNRKILKRFKGDYEATEGTLRVLFSVEKINEGVHIDNLDGVIMLRPTKSKIVFKQQLGRVMSISKKAKDTIVFDIVNNIDAFQEIHDFMDKVAQIRIQNNPEIDPKEIQKQIMEEFNITDETRDVREILRKVTGGLETEWEECYQRSVRWREEHDGNAPRRSRDDTEKTQIYNWEKYQKLKYLKEYQDMDEANIPEKYIDKVVKLKKLGLKYIEKDNKSTEETFEAWKKWTLENGVTPSVRSKNEAEKKLAAGMSNTLQKMRKDKEKYKDMLEEYEQIYLQYGRHKDYKTKEETFEAWKKGTLENMVTPIINSGNEIEKKVAVGMSHALQKIRKDKEKYKDMLEEYEQIYLQYGRHKDYKTKEETFEAWKKWTLENGVTPSINSRNETEKKLAVNMAATLQNIRKDEEKYKDMLEEYKIIYAQYGRMKDNKSTEETFEAWKKWTLENGVTPRLNSENKTEKKLAAGMSNTLQKMRKDKEKYKDMLEEHERIYVQYGRMKDNKSTEETFEAWKKWTLENGVTPSVRSKNEAEKKLAAGMSHALQKMRKDKEKYKDMLEEYKIIYAQYGRYKDYKTKEETFEAWKKWTLENGVTPSINSRNETEKKLAMNMAATLQNIRKDKEKYKDMLEEYEEIYAKYGRRKLKKLQEEKSELLEDVTKLKEQAKEAEKLDNETKDAVQKVIDEKSQKHEDIGE